MIQFRRNRDAAEIVGGQNSGVGCLGDGYIGASIGMLGDRLRDLVKRTVEPFQSIDTEDDSAGSGLFKRWRKSFGDLGQVRQGAVNAGKHLG